MIIGILWNPYSNPYEILGCMKSSKYRNSQDFNLSIAQLLFDIRIIRCLFFVPLDGKIPNHHSLPFDWLVFFWGEVTVPGVLFWWCVWYFEAKSETSKPENHFRIILKCLEVSYNLWYTDIRVNRCDIKDISSSESKMKCGIRFLLEDLGTSSLKQSLLFSQLLERFHSLSTETE